VTYRLGYRFCSCPAIRAVTCLAWLLGALGRSDALAASNQPPEIGWVGGTSECPHPADVDAEIRRLVPQTELERLGRDVLVVLFDRGESLEVNLRTSGEASSRIYPDPARDCARRATFAAVFVTLALMPPDASLKSEQPVVSPPPPPVAGRISLEGATSPVREPEPTRLELGAGVIGRAAPPLLEGASLASLGFGLRVAVTTSPIAPFLSLVYADEADIELAQIRGGLRRWSLSTGFAWRAREKWPSLELSLGGVVTSTRVRGMELVRPRTSRTYEWGVRGGLCLLLLRAKLAPFAALDLDAYPMPAPIRSAPRGRLGTTPPLDVTSTLGARLRW